MPLYWREAGKLTGYSRIRSRPITKNEKVILKMHETILKYTRWRFTQNQIL
jgi:hypothetical protein